MTIGGVRGRVFAILLLCFVLPVWVASFVGHGYVLGILERAERRENQQNASATSAARQYETAQFERDRGDLAIICDRDVAIDRAILSLSQGHTEREAAAELDADLPIVARTFKFDILSVYTLGTPDSGSSRSLVHAGPRPQSLRTLIDSAQSAGDAGFQTQVEGRDFRMSSCVVSRAAARLLVIGGRRHLPLASMCATDDVRAASERESTRLLAHVAAWGVSAAAFLLAIFMTWLVSRTVEQPLRALEVAAGRVAAGDLDSTIRSTFGGKADRTMGAFNRMTHELNRTQQRLLRAERIAAWRDIARRIAHEIKNPLLPIQMSIETMQKTYASKHPDFDEIFKESTSAILEEVDRLKHIVTEFSRFARMPKPNPEQLDVREVIQHVVQVHATSTVPVTAVLPATLRKVNVDRDQLVQVLVNLVQNGIDAARAANAQSLNDAKVAVEVNDDPVGDGVVIVVRDNGAGIPLEARARIFDPYFTTKSHGTGLGLAIVHRIVSDHGGTIDIVDAPLGGTEFRVVLGRQGPQQEADASVVS
ncbi:MAG: hypothetical protein IPK60_14960 [Sandaracinaceae bacterium]|nr:hypothetical protein [Sandaracinaceae bacterium]